MEVMGACTGCLARSERSRLDEGAGFVQELVSGARTTLMRAQSLRKFWRSVMSYTQRIISFHFAFI